MSEEDAPESGVSFKIGVPSVKGSTIEGLPDFEARRRIREDLDATLIVEAAAGTGKTTELVTRIIAVLRAGRTTLDRIVAVTFTEKAAGELKLRLRGGLEKARVQGTPDERARLERAQSHLEVARIGTIHSLCADLLRERPVEAHVDPLFEVVAEDQGKRLFQTVFERWFHEALAEPPPGVTRVLRRKPKGRDRVGPRRSLRDAAFKLVDRRDFQKPWRRPVAFDRDRMIDKLLENLAGIAALAALATDREGWLTKAVQRAARWVEELERREAVSGRDYDGLEAELVELAHWKDWGYRGRGQMFGKGIPRADVLRRMELMKSELEEFERLANADLAALLYGELSPLISRYQALKQRTGMLDFVDLLLGARDLVKNDRAVREELQERFTHLFVDEFQDTDPLQAEILLLLSADDAAERDMLSVHPVPGKLFLVGDPKQSIYRFRRADVALYERIKAKLAARGASVLHLSTSFRSAPSIQAAVNAAFAPLMQANEEGTQASYVALQPFREDPVNQPTVVALPVPAPYSDYGKVTSWAIDASIPDVVGAFVEWLVTKSGFTITEREAPSKRQPIEARHVCILFKRFQSFDNDLTRPFVKALEARNVPHVLLGGRSFYAREEVVAIKNVLEALEWPEDELAVYATLRGPFLALTDDLLLAHRATMGSLHPLFPLDPEKITEATRPVAEALELLKRLHLARNERPIAATLGDFLSETRAHAGIAIWPTGEQALANVLRVLDLARRFEARGATSFRAFVDWLDEEAEGGQAGDAPVVEEGTEGVRIMTVHRAKGLEFPVVILADPTATHTFTNPTRHLDAATGLCAEPLANLVPLELLEHRDEALRRDHEESIRLAYVGATRAREMLVVPVNGDGRIEGWLDVLDPVLYPPGDKHHDADAAPGCPPFGFDSVVTRPDGVDPSFAVMPGLHTPRQGGHRVVWWDPASLRLGVETDGALRQQRILTADKERDSTSGSPSGLSRSGEGVRAHAAWSGEREALLGRGAVETFVVHAATDVAEERALAPKTVAISVEKTLARREGRPRGKRFGTLVHGLLAEAPLAATRDVVRRMAALHGRAVSASAREVEAATHAVLAALAHPLLLRAAESKGVRRECPVLSKLKDGALVEGIVDLAFRDDSAGAPFWEVVDFKTDLELESNRAVYEAQLELYAKGIAEATGEPVRATLLLV